MSLPSRELLNRVSLALQAENRLVASEAGLQAVHVEVLRYLERCNRYSNTPAAIALYLNTTKGTVSQSIKVLERKKLVRKTSDPEDKRVVRLGLTRKGSTLLERIDTGGSIGAAIEALPERESRALARTLESLLRAAQRANALQSFGVCRTCRFFTQTGDGHFECGITKEPLSTDDSIRICVEHESAA